MLLNYDLQPETEASQAHAPTVVLIHGLFGSIGNLGMIARALKSTYSVLQIDLRNHGLSGQTEEMNYTLMAQDILETLDHLNIQQCLVIGHSMGGKVAMRLANLAPERVEKLVVLDIAPVAYDIRHHDVILQALFSVERAEVNSRTEATQMMREYLSEEMVIQFLMKSFVQGKWRFNIHAIDAHYDDILDWRDQPAFGKASLFIRGGASPYVKEQYFAQIKAQFPLAQIQTVEGAGHWLHAEKPEQVLALIQDFL